MRFFYYCTQISRFINKFDVEQQRLLKETKNWDTIEKLYGDLLVEAKILVHKMAKILEDNNPDSSQVEGYSKHYIFTFFLSIYQSITLIIIFTYPKIVKEYEERKLEIERNREIQVKSSTGGCCQLI